MVSRLSSGLSHERTRRRALFSQFRASTTRQGGSKWDVARSILSDIFSVATRRRALSTGSRRREAWT